MIFYTMCRYIYVANVKTYFACILMADLVKFYTVDRFKTYQYVHNMWKYEPCTEVWHVFYCTINAKLLY